MSPKATSLLTDPQPHSHIVYPSANEALISDAVRLFASSGLSKGDAVIVVATHSRCANVEDFLKSEGFDVEGLIRSGQLAFLEAGALLTALIEDDVPDATLFKRRVGRIVERARFNSADGETRRVRIFGEMVSLLYASSDVAGAERLEDFWNQLIESQSVALLCAYSLRPGSEDGCLPACLVESHSHDLSSLELGT